MAIEAALFIPVLLLLIVGTVQLGKVTYVYAALKKIVWAAGRQLAVQQGVNYCDIANDPAAQAAITFALNDAQWRADYRRADDAERGGGVRVGRRRV